MNMYVNYYASEVNDEGDDKPIGIILCADASEIVAEYAYCLQPHSRINLKCIKIK